MKHALVAALSFGILASATPSPAHAQPYPRTWVSAAGDDANPCSRTAPCKTFQAAVFNTEANGEVDVLDAGGFGPFTINRAITIDGKGAAAGIMALAGLDGIKVSAGNDDLVILRVWSRVQ